MCGITGYVSLKKFDGIAMSKSMIHRGPDDFGEYTDVISGKNIYFAHNRLSIIDLSVAGHQPMVTDDKQIAILYNGEVYNFKQLRDKYIQEIKLKSRSDTEVILYLYQKYGIEFVKEMNGDFAIAILDKRINKIYLIRDRFGVKPLYYTIRDNYFIFASEIKAILASGESFPLQTDNLQNYFVFKYSPLNETLFTDISRLEPAHYLEYDIPSGKATIHCYWELQKNVDFQKLSYHDARFELYNLLEDAINIRLMADVPVGTFFSGGIDSSIIASFLRDMPQITHYTAKKSLTDIKNEGTTADYSYALDLARKWNLNLKSIDIGSQEANSQLIGTTLYYSDDLIADGSQIPSYLITQESKKTSTVMLSGMGADELFFGYKSHQLIALSNLFDVFPQFMTHPFAKFFSRLDQGRGMFKPYRRHLHQFGKYYYSYPALKCGLFGIVGDYENAISVLNNNNDTSFNIIKKYFNNTNDVFDNNSLFEKDNFLVKNLHYVDRMCMANSVEGRVPFLDHRVAEFAFSIPRHYKISEIGKTKLILKDTFKNILPQTIIQRRKAGFGMPLRSIFSSRDKVYQLLNRDFFSSFHFFSVNQIDKLIDNHITGKEDNSAIIYALISFQEWYKLFF